MGRGSGRGSGGGQAKLAKRNAATSRGAAQTPLSSAAHDSDSAGREDVQDLRASLARAEARATAAQSRADAAEHKLKALHEKAQHEKGVASAAGVADAPAAAQEEQAAPSVETVGSEQPVAATRDEHAVPATVLEAEDSLLDTMRSFLEPLAIVDILAKTLIGSPVFAGLEHGQTLDPRVVFKLMGAEDILAALKNCSEEIKSAFEKQKTEFEQDQEGEATATATNSKFATDPNVFVGAFGSVDEFIAGVTAQVYHVCAVNNVSECARKGRSFEHVGEAEIVACGSLFSIGHLSRKIVAETDEYVSRESTSRGIVAHVALHRSA